MQKKVSTIAFGSCNREDLPQDIWNQIALNNPDLWIWTGDNIYGDSEDMNVLKEKYLKQKNGTAYRKFRENTLITGIWDDHDFGVNDGGKEYPYKKESKALMLDFLDVPRNEAVWNREGAYQSYTFGPPGKKIKLILLDSRYFRDPLQPAKKTGVRYEINEEGDILGEPQWAWLKNELSRNEADFHLLANGIQIIPEEQGFEKWANFPKARTRLLNLLEETKPKNPLLISGDRHIAEYSRLKTNTLDIPEITSSGLTHTWETVREEPNKYRLGKMVVSLNFGLLHIDWNTSSINFEIRDQNNQIRLSDRIW
jgi:alkaline phosphatase D